MDNQAHCILFIKRMCSAFNWMHKNSRCVWWVFGLFEVFWRWFFLHFKPVFPWPGSRDTNAILVRNTVTNGLDFAFNSKKESCLSLKWCVTLEGGPAKTALLLGYNIMPETHWLCFWDSRRESTGDTFSSSPSGGGCCQTIDWRKRSWKPSSLITDCMYSNTSGREQEPGVTKKTVLIRDTSSSTKSHRRLSSNHHGKRN